mgnify:CR=1 FL=1
MIDDATLAGWERLVETHQDYMLTHALKQAIAEIRRLREVERAVWSQGLEADGQTMATLTLENQRFKASLAAHRAVVRELATLLDVDALPEFANEGDTIAWVERKNAALTHPLVQQAWEEKR